MNAEMLKMAPIDERTFALTMRGFTGQVCAVGKETWKAYVEPILKRKFKADAGSSLTGIEGEELIKLRKGLMAKFDLKELKTTSKEEKQRMGWSKIDKRTWMYDNHQKAGNHLLIKAVGTVSSGIKYGAYRGKKYIGAFVSLEEAMIGAESGPLPPSPSVVDATPLKTIGHNPLVEKTRKLKESLSHAETKKETPIKILKTDNPFRPDSKRFKLFELLKKCKTFEEFKKHGGNSFEFGVMRGKGVVS